MSELGDVELIVEEGPRKGRPDDEGDRWWCWSYLLDYLVILVVIGVLVVFYKAVDPRSRYIVPNDPNLSYPRRDFIVSTWLLFVLALVVPIVIMVLFALVARWKQWISTIRMVHTIHHAVIGILFSTVFVLMVCEILKCSVGRPRPNYYGTVALENGQVPADALKSWPSSHSSMSWADLVFLSYFLFVRCKGFGKNGGRLWLYILCLSPLALALFVSTSR